MDDSVTKDLTWFLQNFWSTLLVALLIYGGGLTANQVVKAIWPQTADLVDGKTTALDQKLPLFFRIWYATRLAHPFVVGAAIGFGQMLPHPEFVMSRTASVLWFGAAGGFDGKIAALAEAAYRQMMRVIGLVVPWLRQRLGLPADSSPPPAHDPTPSTSTPLADTLEPHDDEKKS